MVDIKMRQVNVQIFIDPHTTQVVQYRNQQILSTAGSDGRTIQCAVRKGIFRQFVTPVGVDARPAKSRKSSST